MNSESYFGFLNRLRESGSINMFGAPEVLRDTFGLTKKESHGVFLDWTKTFEETE